MAKAGGIITLIAGIFAVIAAIITLFVGGVSTAVEADGGNTVLALGWVGLLGSFAVIVMGAVGMGAKTKKPGIITILLSIGSAIFGGTFVAVCMVLSIIGGILMTIGGRQVAKQAKIAEKPAKEAT